LAISVDKVSTHKEWEEKELSRMIRGGIVFPLLSDPGGSIGRIYGVYNDQTKTNQRGRFIIDPNGVIQSMEVVCDPLGRNITEVLRQLRALHHQRSTGELMPCGWEPGKPTLPTESEPSKMAGGVWRNWKPHNAF
jgi:peroxiredoxin (alkyl hydroperoxide reductase subunit C)